MSTTRESRASGEFAAELAVVSKNITESAMATLGPERSDVGKTASVTENGFEPTSENVLTLNADVSNSSVGDHTETYVAGRAYEPTSESENIPESTTEESSSYKSFDTKTSFESTSEDESVSKSITTPADFVKRVGSFNVVTGIFDLTPLYENDGLESTTQILISKNYESYATSVPQKALEPTSTNKNILESETAVWTQVKNNGKDNVKEITSEEDKNNTVYNKFKDGNIIYQSIVAKLNEENKNNNSSKPSNYDDKRSKAVQELREQPEWQPICFYPVPCSRYVLNYQRNAPDSSSKSTIHYSAQSLSTYKKHKSIPLAEATIIKNNYPVIAYCPVGMVCPMTDFAGQPNTLHCMLKSTAVPEVSTKSNKNEENASNQKIKNANYNYTRILQVTTMAKNARDSEEISTGKILWNFLFVVSDF